MKIVAISDVHIKKNEDSAFQLMKSFLNHPLVRGADKILLLGDIFDLMCGPHNEYFNEFHEIFYLIDGLIEEGKEVFYFEGNHDVHLTKLFCKRWKANNFIISQAPIVKEWDGKSYYISHGDEHEVDNLSYQKYKKLITSPFLTFVANYIMPYSVLRYLGENASKMSREKGKKNFDADRVRSRFRSGVQETVQGKYNFIIGGHSHVVDHFQISEQSQYLNNGYALNSRTFIYIEGHIPSFVPL